MGNRAALWAVARRQDALFTKEQARAHLTEGELRYLVENGDVVVRRRGVYAVAGAMPTYQQNVLAALLAAGFPAWASHRTAAKLHGLLVPPPVAIDVLTLPNRRLRLEGVQQHRNRSIAEGDLGRIGFVPTTTPAKTLIDCLPWLRGRQLGRAIDDGRRRRLLTVEEVEAALEHVDRGRRTGRHLVVPARPAVADRHHAGGSERELDVLRILRRAGVRLPVQQFRVFVAGRWRVLDYAYPAERIYLEFDGFAEHGLLREVFDDDREREAELVLRGWLPLHFTSNTRPADLVSRVQRALEARAA